MKKILLPSFLNTLSQYLNRLFFALIFIFSTVGSISNASPSYSSEEAESKTWSYTNLTPIWVQGSLTARYCSYDVRRFRGCFAGLDVLAQQKSPLFRLRLQSEISPNSKVVFTTSHLAIIELENVQDLATAQLQKAFWVQERQRYKNIQAVDIKSYAVEVEELAVKLLAAIEELPPFRIARVLNAIQNYIYDSNTFFWPSARYDASPVPLPALGVGFSVLKNEDGIFVDHVVRGSAADSSGVQPGDKLLKVDGVSVENKSIEVIRDQILASPLESTKGIAAKRLVEIDLGRNTSLDKDSQSKVSAVLSIKLKTEQQTPKEFEAKTIEYSGLIYGYLSFEEMRNTSQPAYCNKIAKKLLEFERTTQGMILDLRGTDIESPDFAACIAGFFIGSKKQVFVSRALNSDQTFFASTSSKKVFWRPLVILQDNRTLGASELISGALQIYGRAVVVGQTSGGRAIELVTTLTERVERYEVGYVHYLPNGVSPHTLGNAPDVKVFRQLQSNSIETRTLSLRDVGLEPLLPARIKPLEFEKNQAVYSPECLEKRDYINTTMALPLRNPNRDFQLGAGLAILSCIQQKEL